MPAIGGNLVSLLKRIQNQAASDEAAMKLVEQLGDQAVEPLIALLQTRKASDRRAAALALGQITQAGPQAADALIAALEDLYDDVREAAAESLGKIGGKYAVGRLSAILQDSTRWEIAAYPLEKIGVGAVETFLAALTSENRWMRKRAAEALGGIHDKRAIEPLKPLLTDDHWQVRLAAAEALRELGQPIDDAPELIQSAPKEVADPRLAYYVRDPWNKVIGSDSASFVYYASGLIIYRHYASPTGYLSIKLTDAEQQQFIDSIPISALQRGEVYSLSPGTTDSSLHRWIIWDRETVKNVAIEGDIGDDAARGIPIYSEPPLSAAALNLYLRVTSFNHPQAQPWLPEKIEVMLWSWEHAQSEGVLWPESWPDLDDPETVQTGLTSFTLFIDSSHFEQLHALAKQRTPILLASRCWSMHYRFPIPGESDIWAAANQR